MSINRYLQHLLVMTVGWAILGATYLSVAVLSLVYMVPIESPITTAIVFAVGLGCFVMSRSHYLRWVDLREVGKSDVREEMPDNAFLVDLRKVEHMDGPMEALDYLYGYIDTLLQDGRTDLCGNILAKAQPENYSPSVAYGILSSLTVLRSELGEAWPLYVQRLETHLRLQDGFTEERVQLILAMVREDS